MHDLGNYRVVTSTLKIVLHRFWIITINKLQFVLHTKNNGRISISKMVIVVIKNWWNKIDCGIFTKM